jgi:hypothetical protein
MIAMDCVGYFSDEPGSQRFPLPLLSGMFPDQGNFLAVVGDFSSRSSISNISSILQEKSGLPIEGAALPQFIPQAGWSDHWSFWQFDYPGVMVTDTALFRNDNYHHSTDLPDTLDYARMSKVFIGVFSVLKEISQ